jgi:restriction system protein
MLPFLQVLEDGSEKHFREITNAVSERLGVTTEERRQRIPSGLAPLVDNRLGWARTYLKKAGLIAPGHKRGLYKITERGLEVLRRKPQRVDIALLSAYPEFREFRALRRPNSDETPPVTEADAVSATPEESLDTAYTGIRKKLEADLLEQIMAASPEFFERLVLDVLVSLGYGGSLSDAAQSVGGSGDGGVDGIIKEDRLGLDTIYVQAKRWENTVGRPEVQKFAGALQGHRARKGVMMTTSVFSREAIEFVKGIDTKVVLIDGETLSRLMVDNGVGVSTTRTYELKKVDSDYFEEE